MAAAAAAHMVGKAPIKLASSSLTQLNNGFRITSCHNNRPVTTVGLWIDGGSRYEHGKNNGISSFVEHLNHNALTLDLAKIGARLNSYTSREHTAYFVQMANGDVEKAVEILARAIRKNKIDDSTIEAGRNALIRKLHESEANTMDAVFDNLHATAFQGTPFALSPLGNADAIKNITRQDLLNLAEDYNKPVRMVLAGVGGVNHEQLTSYGEKYFGDLSNDYQRKIPTMDGVRFTGSEFLYRDDTYPFVYGAISVEGVAQSHPDAPALQLASSLVSGWDNRQSVTTNAPLKIIQKLSVNPALQNYQSFSINYNNTGLFGFQFTANGDDMEVVYDIVKVIQREWKYLATSITDVEIDRVKNKLLAELLSITDDSARFADRLGRDVLNTGNPTHLDELESTVKKLDASDVREAVSRHVYDRDIAVAGIGRTEAWPNYPQMRYGMSWWRL